jgi:hypothetical protein
MSPWIGAGWIEGDTVVDVDVEADVDAPPHAAAPPSSTTSAAPRTAGLNSMSHSRLDITRHDGR